MDRDKPTAPVLVPTLTLTATTAVLVARSAAPAKPAATVYAEASRPTKATVGRAVRHVLQAKLAAAVSAAT